MGLHDVAIFPTRILKGWSLSVKWHLTTTKRRKLKEGELGLLVRAEYKVGKLSQWTGHACFSTYIADSAYRYAKHTYTMRLLSLFPLLKKVSEKVTLLPLFRYPRQHLMSLIECSPFFQFWAGWRKLGNFSMSVERDLRRITSTLRVSCLGYLASCFVPFLNTYGLWYWKIASWPVFDL